MNTTTNKEASPKLSPEQKAVIDKRLREVLKQKETPKKSTKPFTFSSPSKNNNGIQTKIDNFFKSPNTTKNDTPIKSNGDTIPITPTLDFATISKEPSVASTTTEDLTSPLAPLREIFSRSNNGSPLKREFPPPEIEQLEKKNHEPKRAKNKFIVDSDEEEQAKKLEDNLPTLNIGSFSFTHNLNHNLIGNTQSPKTNPKSQPSRAKSPYKPPNKNKKNKNEEQRYDWLEHVLDSEKRSPDHPDYDKTTLFTPPSAIKDFTPFEKQYWDIKSKNFDKVVFFKKGKFYELYEQDALIGHQKLDLKLTDRVNMKMVGVPELSFEFWASKFIRMGYKVAKVDQMETSVAKSMREKDASVKEEKIIRRGLTRVLTLGTLVDSSLISDDMNTYCLSIKTEVITDHALGLTSLAIGVVYVDTSTSKFNLAYFVEPNINQMTLLETLILQIKPTEVVYEKNKIFPKVLKLIQTLIPSIILNPLVSGTQFWDNNLTLFEIESNAYFDQTKRDEIISKLNPILCSSLGGLIYYLRTLKLDKETITFSNFHFIQDILEIAKNRNLVLDGSTLKNLDVLENSNDGSQNGSLLNLLNHCVSPFGKRLFKQWLCHPLRSLDQIRARMDAVEEINSNLELCSLDNQLKKLPDLERWISRIFCNQIKIADFIMIINAMEKSCIVLEGLKENISLVSSSLLIDLILSYPNELLQHVSFFKKAFDHENAIKEGYIVPYPGVEEEYDAINAEMLDIEEQYKEYLRSIQVLFKNNTICYKHIGKERYQLEMPTSIKTPANFSICSQTKTVKRYWTSNIVKLNKELEECEERRNQILGDIKMKLTQRWALKSKDMLKVVNILAQLDCLISLSKMPNIIGEPFCRPEFIEDQEKNVLLLEESRHPCLNIDQFVSNDISLGLEANKILLTGPNMGGKSTLLRQTCILTIMAQLGSYVPAKSMKLTPKDRIFTRIGANDNILTGQSTFMIELMETNLVLKNATNQSLIILDELGRGTSTLDGYSIAYSTLHHLANTIPNAIIMFTTHYFPLTKELNHLNRLRCNFMLSFVDDNNKLVITYELKEGVAAKSYGLNVATLARIPKQIVDLARDKADNYDQFNSHLDHPANGLPVYLKADLVNVIKLFENGSIDGLLLRNLLANWENYFN